MQYRLIGEINMINIEYNYIPCGNNWSIFSCTQILKGGGKWELFKLREMQYHDQWFKSSPPVNRKPFNYAFLFFSIHPH